MRGQRSGVTGTDRSYIWCHQEPTRPTGTRQRIHDATSQWMCCGKWSALWTSYVIVKRVPKHERKSISRNLFIFGPMLIGTFLLILGWGIPRKSLWHRFWNTLYVPSESTQPHHSQWKILGWRLRCSDLLDSQRKSYIRSKLKINNIAENWKVYEKNWLDYLKRTKIGSPIQSQGTMEFRTTWAG